MVLLCLYRIVQGVLYCRDVGVLALKESEPRGSEGGPEAAASAASLSNYRLTVAEAG